MNVAIILAGGKGVRAGLKIPKQFAEVLGKPVIAYTLEIFQNHPEIDAIEIVCVNGYIDTLWDICRRYNITKTKWIVEGGENYQQSVLHGVQGLSGQLRDDDIVTIHTGVAPFLDADLLTENLALCREKGNAITSYTLYALAGKRNEEHPEMTNEGIDRDSIICMKNPHSFRFGEIRTLYEEAIATGVIDQVKPYTTSLMFRMGRPIYLSRGTQMNIKITNKEDLELFEAYVMLKRTQGESHEKA